MLASQLINANVPCLWSFKNRKKNEMTKEEKLIREYFEPIEDINGDKTIDVLPLTLVDMLLEYERKVLKLHKHFVINNEVAFCSAKQKPETCPKFKKLKLGCERCYCSKRTK